MNTNVRFVNWEYEIVDHHRFRGRRSFVHKRFGLRPRSALAFSAGSRRDAHDQQSHTYQYT